MLTAGCLHVLCKLCLVAGSGTSGGDHPSLPVNWEDGVAGVEQQGLSPISSSSHSWTPSHPAISSQTVLNSVAYLNGEKKKTEGRKGGREGERKRIYIPQKSFSVGFLSVW